jgi:RNA polymerase sigma-70 factor (ECF subfamily)
MPPLPVWFTGRDTVVRFLVARAFTKPGDMVLIPTAANGQPAVAEYRRTADHVMRAHSIHVLTPGTAGIAALTVFLDPALFTAFGLPPSR